MYVAILMCVSRKKRIGANARKKDFPVNDRRVLAKATASRARIITERGRHWLTENPGRCRACVLSAPFPVIARPLITHTHPGDIAANGIGTERKRENSRVSHRPRSRVSPTPRVHSPPRTGNGQRCQHGALRQQTLAAVAHQKLVHIVGRHR